MDSIIVNIEDLEIGILQYDFDAEIFYSVIKEGEGEYTPASSETKIESVDIISDISCWNTETEEEYIVTDLKEIKMVRQWVDWKEQLEKKL